MATLNILGGVRAVARRKKSFEEFVSLHGVPCFKYKSKETFKVTQI